MGHLFFMEKMGKISQKIRKFSGCICGFLAFWPNDPKGSRNSKYVFPQLFHGKICLTPSIPLKAFNDGGDRFLQGPPFFHVWILLYHHHLLINPLLGGSSQLVSGWDHPPFISQNKVTWKWNNPILRGRNRSPWVLPTYPSPGIILQIPFLWCSLSQLQTSWVWLYNLKIPSKTICYYWWFRHLANQLRLVAYPIIYLVLYIPGG